jgi:hypothetical protein
MQPKGYFFSWFDMEIIVEITLHLRRSNELDGWEVRLYMIIPSLREVGRCTIINVTLYLKTKGGLLVILFWPMIKCRKPVIIWTIVRHYEDKFGMERLGLPVQIDCYPIESNAYKGDV